MTFLKKLHFYALHPGLSPKYTTACSEFLGMSEKLSITEANHGNRGLWNY